MQQPRKPSLGTGGEMGGEALREIGNSSRVCSQRIAGVCQNAGCHEPSNTRVTALRAVAFRRGNARETALYSCTLPVCHAPASKPGNKPFLVNGHNGTPGRESAQEEFSYFQIAKSCCR
jgi:hypothetical protein